MNIKKLEFEMEKLKIKRTTLMLEIDKKDNERKKINSKIMFLTAQINELENEIENFKNLKEKLYNAKEDAKFNSALFSIFLTLLPTIIMAITTKDLFGVAVSLIFCSVVVTPISLIASFSKYFKLKREIKKTNYFATKKELNEKQKRLSLENQRYKSNANEIEELKSFVSEIKVQLESLSKEIEIKRKISMENCTDEKLNDTKNKKGNQKTIGKK